MYIASPTAGHGGANSHLRTDSWSNQIGIVGTPVRQSLTRVFLLGTILTTSTVDLLGRWKLVGNVSAMGTISIAVATLPWLIWMVAPQLPRAAARVLAPGILLLLWEVVGLAFFHRSETGAQDVVSLSILIGLAVLVCRESARDPDLGDKIRRWIGNSSWIAIVLYGFGLLITGFGSNRIIGARSFGIYAIAPAAIFLAEWRAGNRRSLFRYAILVVLVGLSLSRMALFALTAMFAVSGLFGHRLSSRRLLMTATPAFAGFLALVFGTSVYRHRFFSGDTSLHVGGMSIDAEGRLHLWTATFQSWRQHPVLGLGPGSAEDLVSRLWPGIGHPHCAYLQLLHDSGLLGGLLFVMLMVGLVGLLLWSTRRSGRLIRPRRAISVPKCAEPMCSWIGGSGTSQSHISSLILLIGLFLVMSTDNPLNYFFIMAPAGSILGSGLAGALSYGNSEAKEVGRVYVATRVVGTRCTSQRDEWKR